MPDDSLKVLEKIMDVASFRQKLIASNVANADTPGYRAKDISFQDELKRVMSGSGGSFNVQETMPTMLSRDGNTVNLDIEMTKTAENHLLYNSAAQILSMKIKMMKDVIKGGSS
jgi:flagellar basal-body rod protein FlgB